MFVGLSEFLQIHSSFSYLIFQHVVLVCGLTGCWLHKCLLEDMWRFGVITFTVCLLRKSLVVGNSVEDKTSVSIAGVDVPGVAGISEEVIIVDLFTELASEVISFVVDDMGRMTAMGSVPVCSWEIEGERVSLESMLTFSKFSNLLAGPKAPHLVKCLKWWKPRYAALYVCIFFWCCKSFFTVFHMYLAYVEHSSDGANPVKFSLRSFWDQDCIWFISSTKPLV